MSNAVTPDLRALRWSRTLYRSSCVGITRGEPVRPVARRITPELLMDLADSDDEEIAEAVDEAIAMSEAFPDDEDEEDEERR